MLRANAWTAWGGENTMQALDLWLAGFFILVTIASACATLAQMLGLA